MNIIAVIFDPPAGRIFLQQLVAEESISVDQLVEIADPIIFLRAFAVIFAIDNGIVSSI